MARKLSRLVLLLPESLYPKNYLMLFINIHENKFSSDSKGSRDIRVVVFRRWCHNFKMAIVKYSGFWGNIPVAVLGIFDFQGHLADDNKKYGTFICNQVLKHMKEIDPTKHYEI